MNNVLQKELKWLGSPVSTYSGTINEILDYISEFERRPFSLSGDLPLVNENAFMDVIVRKPIPNKDPAEIPIGVVLLRPKVFKAIHPTLFKVCQGILSRAIIGGTHSEDSARQNSGFQFIFSCARVVRDHRS